MERVHAARPGASRRYAATGPRVGVAGHQRPPGDAAGGLVPEEPRPGRNPRGDDLETQDLAPAAAIHAGRQQRRGLEDTSSPASSLLRPSSGRIGPPTSVPSWRGFSTARIGLMSTNLRSRLTEAADLLESLGGRLRPGSFVCPLCLNLRPISEASRGHYPATSVPAVRRRVVLLCRCCNSFLGAAYERDARDYLLQQSRVSFMAEGGGRAAGYVERRPAERPGGGLSMRMIGHGLGREFGRMRDRSTRREVVTVRMLYLDDRAIRRAVLAWSLLDWFRYGGYRYLASPGAAQVRRLIFTPDLDLPPGTWLQFSPTEVPLPEPEPVVLARMDPPARTLFQAQELFGLGTRWGSGVCVLPFASDADPKAWLRAIELGRKGSRVHAFGLRPMTRDLGYGRLNASMGLSDPDVNFDALVTLELTPGEAQLLCDGRHPLRVDVPLATAVASTGTEYIFDVVSDGSVP